MRILAERSRHRLRGTGSILVNDRDAIAWLVPLQRARQVALAADPLSVDLLDFVVQIDAGLVDRPRRRDQIRHASPGSRFEADVAEPRVAGMPFPDREAGARKEPP